MEDDDLRARIRGSALQKDAEAPMGEAKEASSDGWAHRATACRELASSIEGGEDDEVRKAHEQSRGDLVQLLHDGFLPPQKRRHLPLERHRRGNI